MPVTARLSRKFYDQFGDDIASELVEWFNKVDETYRLDLRQLNELNFARFDAKLEQRVSEIRADMTGMRSGLREEIGEMRAGLRAEIVELGQKLGDRIAAIDVSNSRGRETQMRWLVAMWVAQMSMLIGTVFIALQGR